MILAEAPLPSMTFVASLFVAFYVILGLPCLIIILLKHNYLSGRQQGTQEDLPGFMGGSSYNPPPQSIGPIRGKPAIYPSAQMNTPSDPNRVQPFQGIESKSPVPQRLSPPDPDLILPFNDDLDDEPPALLTFDREGNIISRDALVLEDNWEPPQPPVREMHAPQINTQPRRGKSSWF